MFVSVLDLFKIGIGPSSSHTMGPMLAARQFIDLIGSYLTEHGVGDTGVSVPPCQMSVRCCLKGSLAYTGVGHATDRAIALGLNGYTPESVSGKSIDELISVIWEANQLDIGGGRSLNFSPKSSIIFDKGKPLPEHSNGLVLSLLDIEGEILLSETYFSVGGGFIYTGSEIRQTEATLKILPPNTCPYSFDSAQSMLDMSGDNQLSIAEMKRLNECEYRSLSSLDYGLNKIWQSMEACVKAGLSTDGILPGGLELPRRAKQLYSQLHAKPEQADVNDWLCAYAMAVNEENAAGHMVVTAPTNGAAGVIPAILYYLVRHESGTLDQVREFLLTAGAIGGIIKHNSSISGAEVGCQGEVGSAASMAAAGLCAIRGGTPAQIENAAEIALEHHLGMTCDPVKGLVQVPCIERNGFGAIKAYTAASLAIRGSGQHFMSLDACIAAMKQTGLEMSHKFKETSLGGLAVSQTEC